MGRRWRRSLKLVPAALMVAGMVACSPPTGPGAPAVAPPPPRSDDLPDEPLPRPETPAPEASSRSLASRAYYAQVQRALLAQGLLRTDGGGPDTPFDDRILAENFIRIALYDEYSRTGGLFTRAESRSLLRRWEEPVRLQIRFGPSVSAEKRATDRARIASYLERLARLTRHPVSLVEEGGNFTLHIVGEEEREALGPALKRDIPGLSPDDIHDVTNMAQTTYCMVYAQSEGNSGRYTRAVAVIRAEHPDLLRQSCIHEEIAQGLGLANDSPRARPSIFNDDEEFALLTRQDELMLTLLYSPELTTGMSEAEAAPIVRSLARQMLGGS